MAFWSLIKVGGLTVYVLIACSIFSFAIILERIFYYRRRALIKRPDFMALIAKEIDRGSIGRALDLCASTDTPFSNVVQAGLRLYGHNEIVISNTMERETVIETNKLEKYISIIGTLGSTAVYIGLFGTVLGIIRAFHDISTSGSGGLNVVINGIAEALICTAAGLAVAVPAVIAYNYFVKKIDSFVMDMELSTSQVMDLISIKQKTAEGSKKSRDW